MRVSKWFATVMDVQKKIEKEKKRYTLWNFYQKYVYKLYELSFQKDYSRVIAPQPPPPKNIVTDLNL